MKLRLLAALLLSATALTLTGCIATSAPAAPAAATDIYLDYNVGLPPAVTPELVDFAPSGCCSPNVLSYTSGSVVITTVATDQNANVYAAGYDFAGNSVEIAVFAPTSSPYASDTPTRVFSSGFMIWPILNMTVDPSGNLYAYDSQGDLFKFTPDADGTAQPIFMLSGFGADAGMTTDSKGNFYISAAGAGPSGGDAIYVYTAGFDNLTPENIITPPDAEKIDGLAVDAGGNIYASGELVSGTQAGQIEAYAAGATGNATPIRTITGPDTYLSDDSYNTMAIDAAGTLYVRSLNYYDPGGTSIINEFPSTANGDVDPTISFYAGLPLYYPNISIAVASYTSGMVGR